MIAQPGIGVDQGTWINGAKLNTFTSAIVGVLVTLSVILTASVLCPNIGAHQILDIMTVCGLAGITVVAFAVSAARRRGPAPAIDRTGRENWRMPPLVELGRAEFSLTRRIGMGALRAYLLAAMVMVIVKIVQVALGH